MLDEPQGQKPALTVVVQSWWTPALAVIMLVVGLLVGYFGRPLIAKNPTPTTEVIAAVTPPTSAPQNTQASGTAAPTRTIDPTMAAITNQSQLMDYLIANTTHFQGDANAKVTLIEFSDYQ